MKTIRMKHLGGRSNMSSDYEKQLEQQNEELKDKLAALEQDHARFMKSYKNNIDKHGVVSVESLAGADSIDMKFYCDYDLMSAFEQVKLFVKSKADQSYVNVVLSYYKNGFRHISYVFYVYQIEPTMYYQIVSKDKKLKFKDLDAMRDAILEYLETKPYLKDYFG